MSAKELEDLQVKVAFLEDSLAHLSDEHFRQQRELEALRDRFDSLLERMRSQSDGADTGDFSSPKDEKPPHY